MSCGNNPKSVEATKAWQEIASTDIELNPIQMIDRDWTKIKSPEPDSRWSSRNWATPSMLKLTSPSSARSCTASSSTLNCYRPSSVSGMRRPASEMMACLLSLYSPNCDRKWTTMSGLQARGKMRP